MIKANLMNTLHHSATTATCTTNGNSADGRKMVFTPPRNLTLFKNAIFTDRLPIKQVYCLCAGGFRFAAVQSATKACFGLSLCAAMPGFFRLLRITKLHSHTIQKPYLLIFKNKKV